MKMIEFNRVDHPKYSTASIYIKNVEFSLKGCEILNIDDTKYGYQKTVVELSKQMIEKMMEIEEVGILSNILTLRIKVLT